MSDEGFLSRWSRRKAEVKAGVELPAEPVPADPAAVPPSAATLPAEAPEAPEPPPKDPPPTMQDVADLTPGSDFTRFVTRDVDPAVKNAALKKLFADPRFNMMDGLDIYIDDYGKPDPIPASMLRNMAQAQFLGLFEEEAQPPPPKASPDGAGAPLVTQSSVDPSAVPPDEDTDLRLQQDDAAGPGGPGKGPPA
ncbi:DUF3306 domain-containing protein [Piscinibacter sp. XHJ-5]|uniref:DUF3306 domain-containing protein n=1 Tax=Piscinibacter sp. XHJ-5 TaxID=3037797 RepID=UPI0024534449|nr:DUF3306 domain-containing protein [Piscinibacter sp. XHJ-5]